MGFASSKAQKIIATKLEQREKALALGSSYVGSDHDVYLAVTAQEIVTKIEKGEWTSSQVLEAYIARATLSAKLTNCGTEVLFVQARDQAKQLDEEFAVTKRLRGPLHGVVVSFKDQFVIEGVDASIGFTQWANQPGSNDADLVKQLRAAGAIPIMKTNVPQVPILSGHVTTTGGRTMLSFECNNPIWGRTTNPWNDKFTSGGSSGGEGALLAMDGSVIGLGSDIGGSLRIPASYCGIYSIKPTAGRISTRGAKSPVPGFESIRSVVGPMARSVSDLEVVSRIIYGQQGANREIAPLPYRDVKLPAKLKFGYYTSDCVVKASPACKRAVLETVEALRKEGHECVELDMSIAARAFYIFCALTSADGYQTLLSHLGPDKKDSSLFLVTLGPSLPGFLRTFGGWVAETFFNDTIFATCLRLSRVKPFREIMQHIVKRNELIDEWNEKVWDKNGLDGIIAPVQAMPVIPHGGCEKISAIACATILYNVIDSPVGCLPVTRVDPAKDKLTDEWVKGPGRGSFILEDEMYKGKKPMYDPEAMKGIPVGVQIAGRKWEDEKVIAMMHVVDKALGPRGFGPLSWSREKEETVAN